jgi:hypothetical protein
VVHPDFGVEHHFIELGYLAGGVVWGEEACVDAKYVRIERTGRSTAGR